MKYEFSRFRQTNCQFIICSPLCYAVYYLQPILLCSLLSAAHFVMQFIICSPFCYAIELVLYLNVCLFWNQQCSIISVLSHSINRRNRSQVTNKYNKQCWSDNPSLYNRTIIDTRKRSLSSRRYFSDNAP